MMWKENSALRSLQDRPRGDANQPAATLPFESINFVNDLAMEPMNGAALYRSAAQLSVDFIRWADEAISRDCQPR